ncbi:MAG: helix-turn-helix domain-containing protein [Loktanella sp.]|nr:helix-turn-helix domain-containing protein [Loktanella sp.]
MSGDSTLGQRLSELRRASGMSQSDMASALDVSRSSYQYYERDERDLPSSLLLKVSEFLHDDAHRLLTGRPSALILRKTEEISRYVDEQIHEMKIELSPEIRWRVISKVLQDEFKAIPRVTDQIDKDEITSLLKMLA